MRIKQLDILRGVAILLVLGRHPVVEPAQAGIFALPASLWHRFGWTGVDLFFVLSGFLIGGLLFHEIKRTDSIDIKRFWIRRGFKIWPGYLALVAFMLCFQPLYHADGSRYQFSERVVAMAPHMIHLQNYVGSVLLHTWSLAVEEHFYLVLPVLLLALPQRNLFKSVAICCAVVVVCCAGLRLIHPAVGFYEVMKELKWTHLRADSLFFGVFLAAIFHLKPARFQALRSWRWAFWVAGIALICPMFFLNLEESRFVWQWGFTSLYVGYGLILLAAMSSSEVKESRVTRALIFVGASSYSIYLWHWYLSLIMQAVAKRTDFLSGTPSLRWLLGMSLYVCFAVLFGSLMASLIEIPMLKIREKFFPSSDPAAPQTAHVGFSSSDVCEVVSS